MLKQQQVEVKIFNKATIEILSIANIKASVFNQTAELFMISNENQLLKAAQITMYSPFEFDKKDMLSIQQARNCLL